MNNDIENRKFERSQFFLIQKENDFLPIWVFKPEDNPSGILGVLVDVSDGGIQILMQKNTLFAGQQFEMSLINQIGGDETKIHPAIIDLVWSNDVGSTYTKGGFTFNVNASQEISTLVSQTFDTEHKFIRCILRDCNKLN